MILNITLFNSIWVAVLFVESFHFGLREKLLSLELSEIIGTYLKFTMLKVLFQNIYIVTYIETKVYLVWIFLLVFRDIYQKDRNFENSSP